MDNLTAILYGKQDLRLEQIARPVPKKGEVLIAIKKCGICRTDIHLWQNGGCADFQPKDPIIIGHECSGQVIGLGPGVKTLKVGDRVALELGLPCLHCEQCRSGHYNLCKPFSLGGLTQYQVWPEVFSHKLPEHVTDEEGALMEPLAVAVRACRRGGVQLGSTVLIGGAGPIGISCLLAAQAMGASLTCITDVSGARLKLAKQFRADHIVQIEPGQSSLGVSEGVLSVLGTQPDVVLETSGAQHSLQVAMHVAKPGGCVVPVGLEPPDATLPIVKCAVKEVDIKGSFSYGPKDYEGAIAMVASRRVDPLPMITQRFDLKDTINACNMAKDATDEVVKIMINCDFQ